MDVSGLFLEAGNGVAHYGFAGNYFTKRQSLQAAVTSNWGLVESHPPVEQPFQLASDIELTLVDHDLAEKVMDCCDAQLFGFPKPVRQSPQLYSFVRTASQSGYLWEWKPDHDQRLEMCVALSRLVHPTSFPLNTT